MQAPERNRDASQHKPFDEARGYLASRAPLARASQTRYVPNERMTRMPIQDGVNVGSARFVDGRPLCEGCSRPMESTGAKQPTRELALFCCSDCGTEFPPAEARAIIRPTEAAPGSDGERPGRGGL